MRGGGAKGHMDNVRLVLSRFDELLMYTDHRRGRERYYRMAIT